MCCTQIYVPSSYTYIFCDISRAVELYDIITVVGTNNLHPVKYTCKQMDKEQSYESKPWYLKHCWSEIHNPNIFHCPATPSPIRVRLICKPSEQGSATYSTTLKALRMRVILRMRRTLTTRRSFASCLTVEGKSDSSTEHPYTQKPVSNKT